MKRVLKTGLKKAGISERNVLEGRLEKAEVSERIKVGKRNRVLRIAAALNPQFSNREISRATGLPESEVERIVGSDKRKSKYNRYPRSELRKAVALELAKQPEKPAFTKIARFLNVTPVTVWKWTKGTVKGTKGSRQREQPPLRFYRVRELVRAGNNFNEITRILEREEGRLLSRKGVYSFYNYWANLAKRQKILSKARTRRQPDKMSKDKMSEIERKIETRIEKEGIRGREERMRRFMQLVDYYMPPAVQITVQKVNARINSLKQLMESQTALGRRRSAARISERIEELIKALEKTMEMKNAEEINAFLQQVLEQSQKA